MPDKTPATAKPAAAETVTPVTVPPVRRHPGHRGADVRDTVAEMAAKAHEISMEAGSKMAAAMKEVIGAAAGLSTFTLESARDLVQYMVRRSQMTQDEADRLIREADGFGVKTVFALTMSPEFFEKLGFRESPKERFPTKVWRDCLRCDRFSCCNEKAVTLELAGRPAALAESTPEAAQVSS